MDMLVRHLRENAAAWARLLRAPPENLPWKLMAVGVVTCGAAACAVPSGVAACVASSSPAIGVELVSYPCAWLGAAALAFICGLFVVWVAFWVADAAPRRDPAGHLILLASLVPLLIAIGLSGSDNADLIFDILFDAIQP